MTTAIRPQSASPPPLTDEEQLESVGRRNFGRIPSVVPMPNLIQIQIHSFDWFKNIGLRELFEEVSPITDFTGKNMELKFLDYQFGEPRYSVFECRQRDMTYAAPLRVRVQLLIKETGEIKESEIFMGDFPLMTETGTFVINGAERVVVSQLVRSPGAYFTAAEDANTGRQLFGAKLIPNRGAWLEFETSNKNVLSVKVDRKRKIPVTILLRAIGYSTDEDIENALKSVNTDPDHDYVRATIDKDGTHSQEEAVIELYKRLRPGDPPTRDNAENLRDSLLFNPRRYDLAKVGRYKLNKRLGLDVPIDKKVLTNEDLLRIVAHIIELNNRELDPTKTAKPDDIDHLGNRRVRAVGELIQAQFRVGILRMERVIKERMSIQDPESASPGALINIRPVVAAMREFFGGSQLSQFMDQTNPLSELNHKRRLSALGPGGLSRDRAGFDVRDVHESHYGRICPVETPEGPNIGLIGALATYAKLNEFGFIETPYRHVITRVENRADLLVGHILAEDIANRRGNVIVTAGTHIDEKLAGKVAGTELATIKVRPKVAGEADVEIDPKPGELVGHTLRERITDTDGKVVAEAGEYINGTLAARIHSVAQDIGLKKVKVGPIRYVPADVEDYFVIVQANARLSDTGHLVDRYVTVRHEQQFLQELADHVNYIDVSPKQVVSVATALIPFLEHDDANRALMGANMQRQAVPLLVPRSPIIGTGIEWQAARDSGQVVLARQNGEVVRVDASTIVIRDDEGTEHEYQLQKFVRSNQDTCINQRPIVQSGERVRLGTVIADSSSTENGELALGQNVLVAFMSFEGGNFEDAILLSQRLVQDDVYTSIHIEKYEVEARETKLGPEEITRDIPNVGEESLKNLDENGIIYVGAEVVANDILVGKITPKGETELTPEERLLRAIFGEKAREVKDTSLRVPHGVRGKVIDVKVFSRGNNDELPAGVSQMVRVSIAQKRKISVGDKMAGRHGNKGVISKILPIEDMPFLPDGTPIDIILNPLGVPHRMNIGQILETHLGWAAEKLGYKVATPVFDGASEESIHSELERAGLPRDGKVILFDGRTGEPFDNPITVGQIYMLKLAHLVEDKIHARSTGPYSLVTQQPLGGKAQFGGQRFGEMEVWALEAYGAAHTLQEMLTVKSDDVMGRVKTYEAIVKGENIMEVGVPESFKVLVKELQALGLNVEVFTDDDQQVVLADDASGDTLSELEGINLSGFEADERERI